MILVDTSVWVDHLRGDEQLLVDLLEANNVLIHSVIIGELACGNLRNRVERLHDWQALPTIQELQNGEIITLIDNLNIMGRGIGLVDAHILGSTLKSTGVSLWTRDRRLYEIAKENGIAFDE